MIRLLREGCACLIVLVSALNGSGGGQVLASPPRLSARPAVTATADGLLVDWRAPEAQVLTRADGITSVLLPGYSQTARPGAPLLPFISVLVAIPPGATPTLRLVSVEEAVRPLPGPLALASLPEGVQHDALGHPIGGDFSPAAVARPAQSSEEEPVVLELAGVARGVRLARLVFYPARPIGDYPQARLRVTTHVRVALTFAGQEAGLPLAASLDPLLVVLRLAVINPEQVRPSPFTVQGPSALPQSIVPDLDGTGSAWVIEVTTPGLTAITYEALAEIGFPIAGADPNNLHLARADTDIAAEWDGDGDADFEPGERLLFYAEPRFSRWTSSDVYFLWMDVTPGLRVQDRPPVPIGQPVGIAWADATAEANLLYTPDCFCGILPPGRDGDRWTWDDLKRPGHSTASYPIALPAVDAAQPATLKVWLIGYTDVAADPDHRVDVALNGVTLGRIEWDGKQSSSAALPIAPGVLRSDANTISLTLPGLPGVGIEGAWLDAFSIRYALGGAPVGHSAAFTGQPTPQTYSLALSSTSGLRVYDITNPDRPLRLIDVTTDGNAISLSDSLVGGAYRYALATEAGLLFPAALRPAQPLRTGGGLTGADYVMIAPTAFISALGDLITLRQEQGLTVTVENVQAVYDVYGDGRPDPAAIRAYLAHAYAAWEPRPTYVLLVGDGSFDPRQYRAESPPTFIPPYLADVDPWGGETAADNRYVTVDGQDILPDMLIGRLPVKTLAEAQAVVDKIVQYETNPAPGTWNSHVTFVADNADTAGNFAAASEVAAGYVPSPYTSQRIYFTPPATTISNIQRAVLDRWDAGALIIQFTGHASWQQWAVERFLHLDDLSALSNDRRRPIVVGMTCFTGAFHRPEPTLDEGLLTLTGGGAVAAWGATGLGVGTGHSSLAEGFLQAVFGDAVSTVGEATWSGKLSLATVGQHLDLLDTFTLLGDPALRSNRIVLPWDSQTYLPIVSGNQDTTDG